MRLELLFIFVNYQLQPRDSDAIKAVLFLQIKLLVMSYNKVTRNLADMIEVVSLTENPSETKS